MVERCNCEGCKKKLKLIVFDCPCGGKFCSIHRYMNAHNCPCIKEKKKNCKENIKSNNPEVNFQKLVKI